MNAALARQAAISHRRETYVGSWLPEPLVAPLVDVSPPGDASDAAVRAEWVSMALMVVLETLTPLERVVFLLHEVFGYAHTEIAEILERRPAAVRQLAHRAREHVQARRPRCRAGPVGWVRSGSATINVSIGGSRSSSSGSTGCRTACRTTSSSGAWSHDSGKYLGRGRKIYRVLEHPPSAAQTA